MTILKLLTLKVAYAIYICKMFTDLTPHIGEQKSLGFVYEMMLLSSNQKKGEVNMNVYCCKAFNGSELKHIKYISAISSQMALIEFRGDIDLDELPHLYFNVKQVD